MKHPYSTYLLAVVLPSAVALAAAVQGTGAAWREVRATSDVRMARTALAVLAEERAASPAAPSAGPDAVAAARTLEQIGRVTGYATTLYVDGRRRAGTHPPVGPDALSPALLGALAASPQGLPAGGGAEGTIVARRDGAFSEAVLAVPRAPVAGMLEPHLLLVMVLLLLFAVLAGWIQTGGRPGRTSGINAVSLVLLSLVPALTVGTFLVQAERRLSEGAEAANARDLTRALAVAKLRGVTASPESVRRLTGFDASLVRGDGTMVSTFTEAAPAIASLRAPPGSFTSSGRVPTPAGASAYAALREPGGGFLAVTAPDPSGQLGAFRARAWTIALALGAWLLLVGLVVGLSRGRTSAAVDHHRVGVADREEDGAAEQLDQGVAQRLVGDHHGDADQRAGVRISR